MQNRFKWWRPIFIWWAAYLIICLDPKVQNTKFRPKGFIKVKLCLSTDIAICGAEYFWIVKQSQERWLKCIALNDKIVSLIFNINFGPGIGWLPSSWKREMACCIVALKISVSGPFREMFAGWKLGHLESFSTCHLSLCPLWTAGMSGCTKGSFLEKSPRGLMGEGANLSYSTIPLSELRKCNSTNLLSFLQTLWFKKRT